MPGVSTEQKNAIGKTLADVIKTTIPKIEREVVKVTELKGDSDDKDKLKTLKAKLGAESVATSLAGRHKSLLVGGTDDKRYQQLKVEIAAAATEAGKMLNRVIAEAKSAAENAWKTKIVNKDGGAVDVSSYDKTMQGVLQKIVQAGGAGHHGDTRLGGNHGNWTHWVSGSERIFGKFESGKLKLKGFGRHAGSSDTYNVTLLEGGKTTATTP